MRPQARLQPERIPPVDLPAPVEAQRARIRQPVLSGQVPPTETQRIRHLRQRKTSSDPLGSDGTANEVNLFRVFRSSRW
jgi:hypothetical protein